MKLIKRNIRNALNKLGYEIRKKPIGESELFEFRNKNKWLEDYKITTILDIGANEGQFAKKITHLFPNACLHCFEPLDEPFNKLKDELKFNKNAVLHQFALGDKNEHITINLNEYSPSSSFLELGETHKINFNHAVATTVCNVDVKKLDDLDIKLTHPLLIKIDVQGFEDKVIAGGTSTIKKAQLIIIEITFKELYKGQPLFDNIYRTLYSLGFTYHGDLDPLRSYTGEILQADAIFINNHNDF